MLRRCPGDDLHRDEPALRRGTVLGGRRFDRYRDRRSRAGRRRGSGMRTRPRLGKVVPAVFAWCRGVLAGARTRSRPVRFRRRFWRFWRGRFRVLSWSQAGKLSLSGRLVAAGARQSAPRVTCTRTTRTLISTTCGTMASSIATGSSAERSRRIACRAIQPEPVATATSAAAAGAGFAPVSFYNGENVLVWPATPRRKAT